MFHDKSYTSYQNIYLNGSNFFQLFSWVYQTHVCSVGLIVVKTSLMCQKLGHLPYLHSSTNNQFLILNMWNIFYIEDFPVWKPLLVFFCCLMGDREFKYRLHSVSSIFTELYALYNIDAVCFINSLCFFHWLFFWDINSSELNFTVSYFDLNATCVSICIRKEFNDEYTLAIIMNTFERSVL